MISKILGIDKIWAYVIILSMLTGFVYWGVGGIYDAGVADTTAKYELKNKKSLEAAIAKHNKQATIDAGTIANSITKLNNLRNKYDDLKIKASRANICKPDFIELYNESIREANKK